MEVGRCVATIVYGQLTAENARRLVAPRQLVSAMFDGIIADFSASALALASSPGLGEAGKVLIRRVVTAARTRQADWDFVAEKVRAFGNAN